MRLRTLIAAAGALALCACTTAGTLPPVTSPDLVAGVVDSAGAPPPVTIADRTTVDETAVIGFETAVRTAAKLATLAVRLHVVPDAKLPALRERVADARLAVGSVRAAYQAGNAASYTAAVASTRQAIAAIEAITEGDAQ